MAISASRLKTLLRAGVSTVIVTTCWLPAFAASPVVERFDPADYLAHKHTVYIDANITKAGGNGIVALDIHPDGTLKPLPNSPFPTGGTGFYDPSFKLGPFDVDQEVVLNDQGSLLYAVNAGSDSISALKVQKNGEVFPLYGQPSPSHGSTPISLGLRDNWLLSLNSAQDPAQAGSGYLPGLTVLKADPAGRLQFLPYSGLPLPAVSQPSQVLTTNTKPFLFTAEFPGGGMLRAFYQFPDGYLSQTDAVMPPLEANNVQPLPLGMWAHPSKPLLYVGFVNTSELGVYRWTAAGKLVFLRAVPNSGKAICWVRVSKNGHFLYTANTADESMSVYDLSAAETPVEIQHIVLGGVGGVQQFSQSPDGHFLFLLQQENSAASAGKSNVVYSLLVDEKSGTLTPISSLQLSLPPQTRPFGVTVR